MKYQSKWITVWIMLLTITLLFGCTGKTPQDSGNLSDTVESPRAEDLQLVKNHKTDYVIVIPEHSKKYVRAMAELLAKTVEAYTGAKLQVRNDSTLPDTGGESRGQEILFGMTNRPEQAEITNMGHAQGYTISVVGQKLLFNSETQGGLYLAVCRFVQDVFDADPEAELPETPVFEELLMPCNYMAVQKIKFSLFPFFDYSASDYCVVYESGAQMPARYAHRVSEAIKTLSEESLVTTTSAPTGDGIQIVIEERETLPRGDYVITVDRHRITLAASTYYGFEGIFRYLETAAPNGYYPFRDGFSVKGNYQDHLTKLTESTRYAYIPAGEVRIMSYNVLWGHPDIAERNRLQSEMISQYMPDVLGLQECDFNNRLGNENNIIMLLESLGYQESMSPEMPEVYRKYNVCPILYNTATTEVLESKYHIYLNQQLQKGETRVLSWAVLRNKANGKNYIVLNTHLEGGNAVVGLGQVQEIESLIQRLSLEYSELPVFLIGDFNFNRSSATFSYLVNTAGYQHARDLATDFVSSTKSTHDYPNFDRASGMMLPGGSIGYDNQGQLSIDQIFLATGEADVRVYGCIADECTRSGSDHFPIFIDFAFTGVADPEKA